MVLLFLLPAEAFETTKINLDINSTYKVKQKGLTKGLVLKSYLADIKIFPDYAEITAHNQGNSYIYLWSGNEVSIYNLNVNIPKQEKKITKNFFGKRNENSTMGRYSVNTATGFNFEKKFNFQKENNLIHNLFYKTTLLDGNISLNSVLLTATKNFNELTDLSIESLNLLYTNQNIIFQIGDLTTEWKKSGLLMKGAGFLYTMPGKMNLKFSGGLLEDTSRINIISNPDKKLSNSNNNIITSLSADITPWSFLEFSPIFTYKQNDKSNLGLRLKLAPLSGLSFNSDLQTDFFKSSQNYNLGYRYDLPQTSEYVETNLSYSARQKDYTVQDLEDSENYFISARMKHRSNLMFSGNYNVSSNSRNSIKNANLRLSHSSFNNSLELFGQTNFSVLNEQHENKFDLGLSFQTSYPFISRSSFEFQEKINISPIESFNLNNEVTIFNNDSFKLNINNSFNYINNRADKNSNSLNNNVVLSSMMNWNNLLVTNISFGLNYNLDENGNSYMLFSKMNNIIKFSNFYDINIQTSMTDNLTKNNMLFNSNISFNYYFGQNENEPVKADISGIVFDDINGNGIVDQDEKAIENIKVFLKDKSLLSGKDGRFCFSGLDAGTYEISIDKKSLTPDMRITTSSTESIELNGKNQEVNFGINNRVIVKGFVYANKNKDKGLANIQINMDNLENCLSEEDGTFSFQVIPGLHVFQVDYTSLPKNYKLISKQLQNIEVKNNEESIIEFIFNPVRTINGIVHSPADTSKGIPGINLKVKYFDDNALIKEETIETDEDGEFSLTGLEKGTVEISSSKSKKTEKIIVPDKPFIYKIKIPLDN